MDKYTIFSFVAPIAAPVAPATVLINTLYRAMQDMNVDSNIALIGSVSSGIGAELSGMIAAYAAVQAYRKGKSGHFWVAIVAFIFYILLIAAGLASGHNPTPLIITVFISIIAYLAVAVVEDLFRANVETVTEREQDIKQTKAQASLTNAQTRYAKATGAHVSMPSTGQTGQSGQALDPAILKQAREYFAANPAASARDWLRQPDCPVKSPTTASKYKAACQIDSSAESC